MIFNNICSLASVIANGDGVTIPYDHMEVLVSLFMVTVSFYLVYGLYKAISIFTDFLEERFCKWRQKKQDKNNENEDL